MKVAARLLSVLLFQIVAFVEFSAAQEIPEGVAYTTAAEVSNKKAESLLRAGLSAKNFKLADIQGKNSKGPVILGPFLSGTLIQDNAIEPAGFTRVDNRVPLSSDVTPVMPGVAAKNTRQRTALDRAIGHRFALDSKAKIRKLTPKEMALIWFFIAWDITEPVFAVEEGGRTLVVDFQDDGESVFWIEEITAPCFRVTWDGGGLDDCFCTVVANQGSKYGVGFEPQKLSSGCAAAHAEKPDHPTTFQNPVDGKSYTADWKTYEPQNGPIKDSGARISIDNIRLLTDQEVIGRNLSAEDISSLIDKTQALLTAAVESSPNEFELLVKTTITPGARPAFELSSQGDAPHAILQEFLKNLATLPDLRSKQDEVSFQVQFKIKKNS